MSGASARRALLEHTRVSEPATVGLLALGLLLRRR